MVSWKTRPMRRRTSAWRSTTSKPATLARPALGRSSVHSIEMVVDLPAPLGPRNPKVWPGGTLKLTPRTASTSSNRLIRPSAWMAAAPSAAGPAAACLEALRTRISHSVVCRHPRFELVLELAVALPPGVQPVEELAEAGDLGLDPCAQAGVVVQRLGQDLGAAFRRPAGPPFGAERRQPVLDPDDFEDLVEVEAHQLLELADVLEAGDVGVGGAARAAGGAAGGGQQAELLVVPQGAAGDAHPGGSLADPQLSGPLGHADIDSSASDIIVDSCSACT